MAKKPKARYKGRKQKQSKKIKGGMRKPSVSLASTNPAEDVVSLELFTNHRIEAAHNNIRLEKAVRSVTKLANKQSDAMSAILDVFSDVTGIPLQEIETKFAVAYANRRVIMMDDTVRGEVLEKRYNVEVLNGGQNETS
jgi:hypothetical protein